MIIGVNRDMADKPIGMRTLGLVALGAAVVSLSTIRVEGMADNPDAMSRVVQGLIQGSWPASVHRRWRDLARRTLRPWKIDHGGNSVDDGALGIACGLAAWTIVGVAVVIALVLLIGIGWLEGIYSTTQDRRELGASAAGYCALSSAAIRSSTATRLR